MSDDIVYIALTREQAQGLAEQLAGVLRMVRMLGLDESLGPMADHMKTQQEPVLQAIDDALKRAC